jgi:bifunctional NMN adenylyltransferase/nudix hydrolase
VDIAVFSPDYSQILLGKRSHETGWRLLGGFADPSSPSLEDDARREAMEEAGVKLDNLSYVRSFIIDDWRYWNEPDCIKTALFIATTSTEQPEGNDDIDRVCWFNRSELDPTASSMIVADHRTLVTHALMRASHILQTKETK